MAAPMAAFECGGKLYPLFTIAAHHLRVADHVAEAEGMPTMIAIALAMFIALVVWGSDYFGWSDPEGDVQLALFTCFVLGALCGYKTKS